MEKRHVEMRHMQKVCTQRNSRNRPLLRKCIDRSVYDADFRAIPGNQVAVFRASNRFDLESISRLRQALQQMLGVGADSALQPPGIDGDLFFHLATSTLPKAGLF